MSRSTLLLFLLYFGFAACSTKNNNQNQDKQRKLSPEATAVLKKLGNLGDRFLIAHQDAPETIFGREWAALNK